MTHPRTAGKFIEVDGERFLIKGVSYGTFAPSERDGQFPPLEQVRTDFAMMARAGLNTVRTYTVPSLKLLDEAARHGLRVMIGLPWSQHVAFLDDARLTREIRREIAGHVKALGSHPAALMFSVGNEIPPSVVRWHGHQRVTRFLEDLCDDARAASPGSLLTYVNYPPTEYLELDCFDVCSFNVYLHREADLRAYLIRLQHLAGNRPLLLAEAGADSIREGHEGQAAITAMHVRAAFEEGLCGAVAFSWTDEWWRGGSHIHDWAFGLVDAERRPKPALNAVSRVFADAPFSKEQAQNWPSVSVVVCAYNAADTLEDCLVSLGRLNYPNFEVIVVNDGSRDATGAIAKRYPVRVIDIPNGGLSAARNLGLAEATGEIVAYTDADVRVDPDWLTYLVQPFLNSDVVGSGGPNVVPPDDPFVAQCVARAPGGPTQVLLDDRIAEHVPGCNMAFRRDALLAIDGFNPVYLRAGDDVDVCWRLQAKKWRIGFAPSALVWHHHRASVKAYWRQQVGYGEGEAWLEAHHPEKFVHGSMLWHGRIYSPLPFIRSLSRQRINSGTWGTAAFPSVYSTSVHPLELMPHAATWQALSTLLLVAGAITMTTSGYVGLAGALLGMGVLGWLTTIARCLMFAWRSDLDGLTTVEGGWSRLRHRMLIAWLHFLQPLARVAGRIRGNWSPPPVVEPARATRLTWKAPAPSPSAALTSARLLVGGAPEEHFWSETWSSADALLKEVTGLLRAARPSFFVDVDDGFRAGRDVSVGVGRWGWLDIRALIEEHGGSKTLLRVGLRLRPSVRGLITMCGLLAALVVVRESLVTRWPWLGLVGAMSVLVVVARAALQTAGAVSLAREAVERAALTTGLNPIPMRARTRPRWQFSPGLLMHPARVRGLALILLAAGTMESAASLMRDARLLTFGRPIVVESADTTSVARRLEPALSGDVAIAPNGDLLVADSRRGVIHRFDMTALNEPMRVRSVVSDTDDRQVLSSDWRIDAPAAMATDRDGDVYVADAQHHRVSRIDRETGKIVVLAGSGTAGFSGDMQPARVARLNAPSAVAVAANGDVYIADSGNHRIRVVSALTGLIRTVAGTGQPELADTEDDETLGDGGPASEARLDTPTDLAFGPDGSLYIADMGHNRVRVIDAEGSVITTLAGDGRARSAGDGGPARGASLAGPVGLALSWNRGQVTVFVAEYLGGNVRAISPGGSISTVGAPRRFKSPSRLAYRRGGWLYVVDERAITVVNLSRGKTIQMAAAVTRTPRHELIDLPSRAIQ